MDGSLWLHRRARFVARSHLSCQSFSPCWFISSRASRATSFRCEPRDISTRRLAMVSTFRRGRPLVGRDGGARTFVRRRLPCPWQWLVVWFWPSVRLALRGLRVGPVVKTGPFHVALTRSVSACLVGTLSIA